MHGGVWGHVVKDWVAFIKSKLDDELWGFVVTDYYYHRRLAGYAQGPERFLLEVLPELTKDLKVAAAPFHEVLMNVAMQLLGNDFVAVMNVSCEAIGLIQDRMDEDASCKIIQQYRIYGHDKVFLGRLHALGLAAGLAMEQDHGSNGSNDMQVVAKEATVVTGTVEVLDRTVVEVDLVGYSTIARVLEENTSTSTVAELNAQIQVYIDAALAAAGTNRGIAVMTTTGDGAILLLDSAEKAHKFAGALHSASEDRNRKVMEAGAKHWFRAGAATGRVTRRVLEDGRADYAGATIGNAVRLEGASRPAEFLIDVRTYDLLPDHLRSLYGPEEMVAGKRDEKFLARRWSVVAEAPKVRPVTQPSSTPAGNDGRRQAVVQMDDLEESELEKLIVLTDMPYDKKPSRSEAFEHRKAAVLSWSTSPHGSGVQRLLDEMLFIRQARAPAVTAEKA